MPRCARCRQSWPGGSRHGRKISLKCALPCDISDAARAAALPPRWSFPSWRWLPYRLGWCARRAYPAPPPEPSVFQWSLRLPCLLRLASTFRGFLSRLGRRRSFRRRLFRRRRRCFFRGLLCSLFSAVFRSCRAAQFLCAQMCFDARQILARIAQTLQRFRLSGGQLKTQPENLLGQFSFLHPQLVVARFTNFVNATRHTTS